MTSDAAPLLPESPEGIKRYSARLITWGGGAAVIVMFILVSMLTPTPKPDNSTSDANEEQEIARLKQQKNNAQKNWFDDRIIPDVPETTSNLIPESKNDDDDDSKLTDETSSQSPPTEYELKVQEEQEKTRLEMERFKQRIPLTRLQQMEDGVRSPLRIISPYKTTEKSSNAAQTTASLSNIPPNARITDFSGSQPPLSDLVEG